MIVYSVSGDSEPCEYHGTKAEALASARDRSKADPDLTVSVERCTLVTITKDVVLRLCNSAGGFVEASVVIAQFRDGRKV